MHQVPGPQGAGIYLIQTVADGAILGNVFQQHLGIADNGEQDIVKIMGNAAGQGADGFHLLGLVQPILEFHLLCFRLFARGNILKNAGKPVGESLKGPHLKMLLQISRIVFEKYRFSGKGNLAVSLNPAGLGAGQNLQNRPACNLFRLEAGHPLKGRIDLQKAIIHRLSGRVAENLVQGKTVQHFLEQGLIILLCLLKGRFRLFDIRKIADDTDPTGPLAGIGFHFHHRVLRGENAAVLSFH